MKELFKVKQKEHSDRLSALCSFLVELTSAAVGGGNSADGDIGIDTGEGAEELTEEQHEMWRTVLGEDEYNRLYGDII